MWCCVGIGCGASVPADVHRTALSQQQAGYEARLFESEQARRQCEAAAAQAAASKSAEIDGLEQRVLRLERAAARGATRAARPRRGERGRRRGRSPIATAVETALGVSSSDPSGGRSTPRETRVSVEGWFDPGSTQLGADAVERLGRLAAFLSGRGDLSLAVHVGRADAPVVQGGDDVWREASARGVAILSALQASGVAAARMTLAVGGAAPEQRIVFIIRVDTRGPGAQGSLDPRAAGRHRRR